MSSRFIAVSVDWAISTILERGESMPIQSAEHWFQKADLARKFAEKMNAYRAKTAMLEIAQLYEQLAEQTGRLEQLGIGVRSPSSVEVQAGLSEQWVRGLSERPDDGPKPAPLD